MEGAGSTEGSGKKKSGITSEFARGAEKSGGGGLQGRVETRRLDNGTEIAARSLVVATGGLSIPKMGATSFGYEVARWFGHSVVETRPGLVPLTFGRGEARAFGELAGVSAMVEAGLRERWGRFEWIGSGACGGDSCGAFEAWGGCWDGAVSRKDAGHASRVERAGDFAGVVVLGERRRGAGVD